MILRLAPVVLGIVLWACGSQSPRNHDKMVLRYNESAGISSLDPGEARNLENIWACQQLYSTLVALDPKLQPQPLAAKSWEIDSTGTVYRFVLRSDMRFHNDTCFPNAQGRQVVAADFVYSFRRIIDTTQTLPGAWIFARVSDPYGAGLQALNDSVLQITLQEAFPPFLGMLSMPYTAVIPREAIEMYGPQGLARHPVGSGPFKFSFWEENEKLVLLKNENYFEKDSAGNPLPYLDAVSISFLSDKGSAFMELTKGKFDFLSGLHPSYKDQILSRTGDLNPLYNQDYYLQKGPFVKTDYLGFMLDSSAQAGNHPLLNVHVRKAVAHSINRTQMVRYLRNNLYYPGHAGFLPPGLAGYRPEAMPDLTYNAAECARQLELAGYPGGKGLPELVLSTTADYADLCEFVQHQLAQNNIRCKVDVLPASTHREYTAQGRLMFFRKSWIADYPDGENFLSLFYSPNQAPAGPNYFRYNNSAFDALYRQALAQTDDSLRGLLYTQLDSLAMADVPAVILYYDAVVRFVSKRVTGLPYHPFNLLDLRRVRIEENYAEAM